MKELDDLIAVLEATIPANPSSPQNVKLANELEKDVKKYFSKLEMLIPTEKLSHIYNKYAEPD
jgi:hypothetical protein